MPTIKIWRQSTFDDLNGLFDEDILPEPKPQLKRAEAAQYRRRVNKVKPVRRTETDYTVQPASDDVKPLSIPMPRNVNSVTERWVPPQAPDDA